MPDAICKCGCGEALPSANKSGFKWGHKGKAATGASAPPPPPLPEDAVRGELQESVDCTMNRDQLDRIWRSLDIRHAALAILTALAEPDAE